MKTRTRPDLAARNAERATHRMSHSPTYNCWRSMLARCGNPKQKDFARYGGRGITVCERWRDFAAFYADMGAKPEGMSLERKDVNAGYAPDNCCWATAAQQANNKRSNVVVEFQGQRATVSEWAQRTGLERKTLEYRIRAGWPADRALTTPPLIQRKAA